MQTKKACREALLRGAPLHAGRNADPSGVLDQQDIIDLIAKQFVQSAQGDPALICKGLTIWSSLQRLPCSDNVYEFACNYLGFYGPEAKEKAVYWLNKNPAGDHTTCYKWKDVFRKLCHCVERDSGGCGLVSRWASVMRKVPRGDAAVAASHRVCHHWSKKVRKQVDPCGRLLVELWDHASYGYIPMPFEETNFQDYISCSRRMFAQLAKSLLGPNRHDIISGEQFGERDFPGEYEQAKADMRSVLVNTVHPAVEFNLVRGTLHHLTEGAFTPNTRITTGANYARCAAQEITIDIAAFLINWTKGMDTVYTDGRKVPNVVIDAVLSHPDYDPRKCINMPPDYTSGNMALHFRRCKGFMWTGGVTLLGVYLFMYHVAVHSDPLAPADGKLDTLARIVDHPLQDLLQRSNGSGLVHICLSATMRSLLTETNVITQIRAEVMGWEHRRRALCLLYDRTRTEKLKVIWYKKDNDNLTPRQFFEHKFKQYKKRATFLLMPVLGNDKKREEALSCIECINNMQDKFNELFIVAERGL